MAYEIDILGEIGNGWGYPANYLRYQLKDAGSEPVTINISSLVGVLTLAGVIVNNGIVMITQINQCDLGKNNNPKLP